MTKLADASINSLPSAAMQADFPVSPSEPSVTVPAALLQDLLGAVQDLKEEIAQDRQEIAALRAQVRSLESLEEQDITRVCMDIAQDRRRLSALESVEPQPLQKDRAEILRALLVANGGKMMAKEARQKMHLSRSAFSQLIATMRDDIELKQFYLKKNQKVIALKSCLAKQ